MSDARTQTSVTFAGGVATVTPQGDIGTYEASSLRTAIKQAYDQKPQKLVIDLSGVPYMATAGLATLVEARQLSMKSSTVLVLCGLNDRVRAVFEISRLTGVFKIVATISDVA